MANVLTTNPMIIDTPGAGVLTTLRLAVRAIKWTGQASAVGGDQAVVQDQLGNTFYDSNTSGANLVDFEQVGSPGNKVASFLNGLIVPTLTHGKLHIYFD